MKHVLGNILFGIGALMLITMAPAVFSGKAPDFVLMISAAGLCGVGSYLRESGPKTAAAEDAAKPATFPDKIGGSAEAEYDKGMIAAAKAEFEEATGHFQESIRLNPTYAPSTAMLELLSDYSVGKLNSEALQACLRGANALNSQDGQTALKEFSAMIDLAPDYSPGYMQRGNTRQLLGDPRSALADFDLALKLRPDTAFIYQARGNVYMNLDRLDEALSDLDRAVSLNPEEPYAYTTRGMLFHKMGQTQKMCTDFKKAANLGLPDNYNLAKQKGLCK